jgi:HPt (histidine-containing phosphotransfer) domain-containing protein
MKKDIFKAGKTLDSAFLEAVYEDNIPTAVSIFQQYLEELPSDLQALKQSFQSGDRDEFVRLVHKKKVAYSYVGLTAITSELSALELKCAGTDNLKQFEEEVSSLIKKIETSTKEVQTVFALLQQSEENDA